jgi:DNA polymerase III epsilon subunit-like protein
MVKICVFDTETTDVPPQLPGKDWNERNANDAKLLQYSDTTRSASMWNQMLPSWPSIVQLSYIIYDTENTENAKIFNKYIDIPSDVVISDSSFDIHHISREKIEQEPAEKKALISDAVLEFMDDIMNHDIVIVVGHNVQFDRKMIIAELLRLGSNPETEKKQLEYLMNNKNFTCTMDLTAPICNIQMAVKYKDKKTGEDKVFYKVKSPKLIEAYQYYFGYEPSGEALHDALIDVIICLRVFIKYKYSEDVCGKNEVVTDYIKKISPEGYVCKSDKENVDIENIKLEIIDPFNNEPSTTTTNSDATTDATTYVTTKTKRNTKRGNKKNKKTKTKRRRSKRIALLSKK